MLHRYGRLFSAGPVEGDRRRAIQWPTFIEGACVAFDDCVDILRLGPAMVMRMVAPFTRPRGSPTGPLGTCMMSMSKFPVLGLLPARVSVGLMLAAPTRCGQRKVRGPKRLTSGELVAVRAQPVDSLSFVGEVA